MSKVPLLFATGLAPIVFISFGGFLLLWVLNLRRYGRKITAVVTRTEGRRRAWLVYTIGSSSHERRYPFSSSFSTYQVGQELSIYYDSERPTHFWIEGDRTPYFIGILFSVLGIASLMIPIILFFVLDF